MSGGGADGPAIEHTAGGPIIEHQWYPCELKDCPECVLLTQFSHAAVPPENVAAGVALVRLPAVTADLVRPLCCCLPLCRIFQPVFLFVRCARAFSHAVQVAMRLSVAAVDPAPPLCCRLSLYCISLTSGSLRLLCPRPYACSAARPHRSRFPRLPPPPSRAPNVVKRKMPSRRAP